MIIGSLEEQVEQLEAKYGIILIEAHYYLFFYRFPGVLFHYQTPSKRIDPSGVNGVVAKLIDMKDPKYATALEITAGIKLSCACMRGCRFHLGFLAVYII